MTKQQQQQKKTKQPQIQKPLVEMRYADELAALRASDCGPKPANWQLSPRAVRAFILGQEQPIRHAGREAVSYTHLRAHET